MTYSTDRDQQPGEMCKGAPVYLELPASRRLKRGEEQGDNQSQYTTSIQVMIRTGNLDHERLAEWLLGPT
jgi:hypothetical protein